MKKIVVLILAALAVMGCSNQRHVAEAVKVQPLDTATVVQTVNDIYTAVFDRYREARTMLKPLRQGNFDAAFCSTDWNEWLKRVIDYDKVNSEGMVGFFEADYWIMGQDWDDLSVSDIKILEMTDTTATVALNLHNCGNVTAVRLEMVNEDNECKIDNFIDATNNVDWKANMKEYLNN